MKRLIRSSKIGEAYNYNDYVIAYTEEGWCVYPAYTIYYNEELAGPFKTWIDAENYVDENLN